MTFQRNYQIKNNVSFLVALSRDKLNIATCVAKDCFPDGELGYPVLITDTDDIDCAAKKIDLFFNRRECTNDIFKMIFILDKSRNLSLKTMKDKFNIVKEMQEHIVPTIVQYEFTQTINETTF